MRPDRRGMAERVPAGTVDCIGHARDRYDRLLAVCYAGGENVNDRLVREGWALDYRKYSTDYLEAEAEAKRRGAGVWGGQFVPPCSGGASAAETGQLVYWIRHFVPAELASPLAAVADVGYEVTESQH
jgi:endonuclease YncB( thermonuclease family)